MQKALELNGKKVLGQEMKLDMPRTKDGAQEGKKGAPIRHSWVSLTCLSNCFRLHFFWHVCGS